VKAFLKQIRISPKKVNLVAKLVRGKAVTEALTLLSFIPKRSAPVLAKLIASAAANAENLKQKKDNLTIKEIVVNGGTTLKRGRPISRGRWHPILKRTSHITVELAPAAAEKAAEKSEKKVGNEDLRSEKKTPEKPIEKKTEAKIEKAETKTDSKETNS